MLVKLRKGQRGFTLVELLVTIAILGTLFGIVTVALNGITSSSTTALKAVELASVQSAADIYLADNYPTTITARASAAVITSTDTDAEFKGFLRLGSSGSTYTYSWDTDGLVTQP